MVRRYSGVPINLTQMPHLPDKYYISIGKIHLLLLAKQSGGTEEIKLEVTTQVIYDKTKN